MNRTLAVLLWCLAAREAGASSASTPEGWTALVKSGSNEELLNDVWRLKEYGDSARQGAALLNKLDAARPMVAELTEACAAPPKVSKSAVINSPQRICPALKQLPQLVVQLMDSDGDRTFSDAVGGTMDAVSRFKSSGGLIAPRFLPFMYDVSWAQTVIDSKVKPLYAARQVPVPARFSERLVALKKTFDEVALHAGEAHGEPATLRDAQLEKQVLGQLKASLAKEQLGDLMTPTQARLYEKSWEIEKNGLGVPLRKVRRGEAASAITGQGYCFYHRLIFSQEYTGGGKYAANTDARWEEVGSIGKCP